jgi:uncharacterized membrane protein YjgN (DUF898 family)
VAHGPAAAVHRHRLGIFGLWLKWMLLTLITLGIYSFWVYPRMTQWTVKKTVYA